MARVPILYISYDGMLEPLGQSQVLAYLEPLAQDYDIHLLSFEKPADVANSGRLKAVGERIAAANIHWTRRRYHKAPSAPATAFDIANGLVTALGIAIRHGIRILHARSYIPALIGMIVKRLTGARLLFDMRGLWADERVDGGLWPAGGHLYRTTKRIEQSLLRSADHIVTLTEASIEDVRRLAGPQAAATPISIITTCADLDRFRPVGGRPSNQFTFGYIGSLGTWYMVDELFKCFIEVRRQRPDARLLIVNKHDHELVRQKLNEFGIDPTCVDLAAVEYADAPDAIRRMTVGTALIRPLFSKISSAPTKLAEYLGCGVPCLGNTGVGDVAAILEDNKVGVALTEFNEASRRTAITRLLTLVESPSLSDRCRETAVRLFSLADGVDAYRSIYQTLLEPAPPTGRRN